MEVNLAHSCFDLIRCTISRHGNDQKSALIQIRCRASQAIRRIWMEALFLHIIQLILSYHFPAANFALSRWIKKIKNRWLYQTDMWELIAIVRWKESDLECGDSRVLIFKNQQQNSLISVFLTNKSPLTLICLHRENKKKSCFDLLRVTSKNGLSQDYCHCML